VRECFAVLLIVAASLPSALYAEDLPAIQKFLHAADKNDFASMTSLLGKKQSGFVDQVANCYLRRVYKNDENGEVIGAWMCSEGKKKSRVVLGKVTQESGTVIVEVVREDRNSLPAPPRTGSAFEK
jgi:hypothetical protein